MLNSSGATSVGSFVEQQLALIMNCKNRFIIHYAEVRLQENSINECGPLALAFATECAFTGTVKYVNFKLTQLRPHLLQCILDRKMQPFPRHDKPRLSKILFKETVQVLCGCNLPPHYDQKVVYCSKCRRYCHYKCNDLVTEPTAKRWVCKDCTV